MAFVSEPNVERVSLRPDERSSAAYQAGLDVYRERDLTEGEVEFLAARSDTDPPSVIAAPD